MTMRIVVVVLLFQLLFAATSGAPFRPKLQLSPIWFGSWPSRSNLRPSHPSLTTSSVVSTLRGGTLAPPEEIGIAADAFGWCANLGAPAALVGGAVLATLAETREDMSPKRSDGALTRIKKKGTRFLLLSAFALEIVSIFVTTVTGTMLLAQGDRPTGNQAGVEYHSPMGFLKHNHEFEYLTARISFLQGLFHWLMATALEVLIPKEGEGEAARRMNRFIGLSLISIILLMLSFYNAHMTFYHNYFHMIAVYVRVLWQRYVWRWPLRPLAYVYIPLIALTVREGVNAFTSPPDLDQD